MGWRTIKKTGNGGRGGRVCTYAIRATRHTGKLAVTITNKTMRRMKWKLGDRIHFLIDTDSGLLGLQRTTDLTGFTLSSAGGKKSKNTVNRNTCVKGKLQPSDLACCVNGSPREFDMEDLIIDDSEDIIAFSLLNNQN